MIGFANTLKESLGNQWFQLLWGCRSRPGFGIAFLGIGPSLGRLIKSEVLFIQTTFKRWRWGVSFFAHPLDGVWPFNFICSFSWNSTEFVLMSSYGGSCKIASISQVSFFGPNSLEQKENEQMKLDGQTPSKGCSEKLASQRHLLLVDWTKRTSVCGGGPV